MDHDYRMLVDGRLVRTSTGAAMEIINPADGRAFAAAPNRDSVERFVERAGKSGARLLLGGGRPNTAETRNGFSRKAA